MNIFKRIAYRGREFLVSPLRKSLIQYPDAATQLLLKQMYGTLAESGNDLPGINEVGFKVFSQTDEDGILLYIFSLIGIVNKKSVEICAGSGIECNTANLIINHGWHGLLVDGDETLVRQGRDFYRTNPHTYVYPPQFVHAWITRDNVNDVINNAGFNGDIDLLSIDMDGVDYWIWEAIQGDRPPSCCG